MREFKDHKDPSRSSETFFKPKVQPKLSVGQPGDVFEKEADAVADKVVNQSNPGDVQKAEQPEEEKVQRKSIAGTISSVQLKEAAEEEKIQQQPEAEKDEQNVQKKEEEKEPLQKKGEKEEQEPVQKMAEKEEPEAVQKKDDEKKEDPLQKKAVDTEQDDKAVQKKAEEQEEAPVQKKGEKEEQEPLQKKDLPAGEEKEPVQQKADDTEQDDKAVQKKEDAKEQEEAPAQRKENGSAAPAASTEARLSASKGEGSPLRGEAKQEMEGGFGADFSQVRIHNDSKSEQMSHDMGAQAFTHGNDIYFNKGKYDPSSRQGKHLLAHELTHTIQQNGAVQKKETQDAVSSTSHTVQASFFGKVWGGIKSAGKAVWSGVKSVGTAIAGGVKAVAGYSWNVLKSAGSWIWNMATETPTRMWRLLQHVGSGVLGTLSWIWDGIKGGAGHVWDALKGTFSWLGEGVSGLFNWIWTGVKGGAKWAWKLLHGDFSGFWDGIADAFSWLGKGVKGLVKWGWEGIKAAAIWASEGVVGLAKWIGRGIVSGAAWTGRLIAKLLDLVGFGEIMDLLFNIVKFNTRTLNSTERQEAQKVFGGSISYGQIRIDERSLISALGSWFQGGGGMGVTLFHTINFNQKISAAAGNSDMRWLIHEMTHVSQYEHVGSQYIGEAIHAQATIGYEYGNGAGLAGKNLKDFNREQQADIIAHYYYYILSGNTDARFTPYAADYNRMADQARDGKF